MGLLLNRFCVLIFLFVSDVFPQLGLCLEFGGRPLKAKAWSALATGSVLYWPWSPQWHGCSTAWSWWSCCGGRSVAPCCTNRKPPAGDQPGMLRCLLPSGLSAALLAAAITSCILLLAQTATVFSVIPFHTLSISKRKHTLCIFCHSLLNPENKC